MISVRLEPTPRSLEHEPLRYRLSEGDDRLALERVLDSGRVRTIHDSITAQAGELIECRRADVRFSESELAQAARTFLGKRQGEYGTWVYFPWSGELVHVLPEAEFEEVRTSRNRNKITRSEQTLLGRLRIGVVGLSVGQSTAVALALEGIGGHYRLADFDALALSNLNRLRAGVHELEVNKAVLTARKIFEINPYAQVEIFRDGVVDENIDAFIGRDDDKLDLLFEECDDLSIKVRLREEARRHGIPILMETSDRGLLDVERFDRDKHRPLFHGLAGDLDSRALRGLTAYEKVPTVLAIIGDISPRGAASLVDVETTLRTWPQLASAVALGSAINTDAARRIALGKFSESGRYYVDLERLVGDGASVVGVASKNERPDGTAPAGAAPEAAGTDASASKEAARDADASSPFQVDSGPLGAVELRTIVTWAALAPSGGNAQPWRFAYRERTGELELRIASERAASAIDFERRGSYVALGAAVENAKLAAARLGISSSFEYSDALDSDRVATLRFEKRGTRTTSSETDDRLGRYVESRATRRSTNREEPLPPDVVTSLCATARDGGGHLDVITSRSELASLADLVASGDKLRLLNPLLHEEVMGEVRWSEAEATTRGDGLDLRSLELTPTDIAAMKLLRSPEVLRTLREIGGGEGLKKSTRKAISGAAAVGLLRMPGSPTKRTYVEGGRVMQRVWLSAEANGIGLHPMTGFLYWFRPETALAERFAHFDRAGAGFTPTEQEELLSVRDGFLAQFPPLDATEILFFRLIRSPAPAVRSLRRPISDSFTIV